MATAHRSLFTGALVKTKAVQGVLVGAAAAFCALLIWHAGMLERLEYATWSWRAQFFAGPSQATGAIKLILLDQQSLDWGKRQIGVSWPWPREVYAPIIDFCARHGARAVMFDVLYSEPSPVSVADDRKLEEAIGRAPFFVASLCLHRDANFSTAWPGFVPDRPLFDIANFQEFISGPYAEKFIRPSATFPIEEVAVKSAALANVIEEPDVDGAFRRANLFRIFDGRVVPSMGFAAFRVQCAENARENGSISPARSSVACLHANLLDTCGKKIPLDREGKLILRFRGPLGAFKSYSAAAVIQSEISAEAGGMETIGDADSFKGAYVFFGFSAPGLADLRPTPLSNICPGVEIHATLLDNLLAGDFLSDISPAGVVLSTLTFAILAAVCVAAFAIRVWHSAALIALFVPLPAVIGFAAYDLGSWWPVVVQEIAVTAALAGPTLQLRHRRP